MEFLTQYSSPIIVGICLCIGYILKNVIPTDVLNKFIPLIVAILGIGLNCWMTLDISPEILLVGMFSGLASTGLHQAFKKFLEGLSILKPDEKINIEEEENDIPEE